MRGLTDGGGGKEAFEGCCCCPGRTHGTGVENQEHGGLQQPPCQGGADGQWIQKRPGYDRRCERTVERRKGQELISDNWEFKLRLEYLEDNAAIDMNRNCRVRKRNWFKEEPKRSLELEIFWSSIHSLLKKNLRFKKGGKCGGPQTSHEVS